MPNTPALNLPYPPPTGVAPDVPYYMQQLAEGVEAALKIKAGRQTTTTDASGNVSWPHGLGVVPRAVLLTPTTTAGAVVALHYTTGTTTTTLAAVIRKVDGTNLVSSAITVNWLAVG